jgi:hypothetical protein
MELFHYPDDRSDERELLDLERVRPAGHDCRRLVRKQGENTVTKNDFEKAVNAEQLRIHQQAIAKLGTSLVWTEPISKTKVQARSLFLNAATPDVLDRYEEYQRAEGNRQLASQVASVRRAMVKAGARTYADR